MTIDSADKAKLVLIITSDNHKMYDNLGAQILVAKLNIKNEVNSCKNVNDAVKHGDEVLRSLNYQGTGTVSQELPNSLMKNMIKIHTTLNQFNTHGCSVTIPTDFYLVPNIFNVLFTDPLDSILN
jgi:hypothetical protein